MKKFAGVSTIALAAAMVATGVQAADAPAAPTDVSAVIVTGTRVTGVKAADSAAPIQVVGSEALKRVGQPDLMQALSQTLPSFNAQGYGADTAALTLSAALRGLNPNDTLVLVNGKRRHTTANLAVDTGSAYQGAATTDLSFIPVGAIDHIEVLQDGAAAQYGTDAIAGVVNIILKKSASGGSFTATGGQYFESDGKTAAASLNQGFDLGGKGFVNVTLDGKFHGFSRQGGADARFFNPNGTLRTDLNDPSAEFGPVQGPLVAAGVQKTPGSPNINNIYGDPSYRIYNLFFNSGYDFSPTLSGYAFGNVSHRTASAFENYRNPVKVSGVTSGGTTVYPLPLGFSPREGIFEDDYSFTAGLKGVVSGWNWDLSTTYGRDHDGVETLNSANADLFPVLQAASATPLAPQRNFRDGSFTTSQWTNTLDIDRSFDVGLASPLNVALGIETRHEEFGITAGEPNSYYGAGAQSFPGYQPSDAGNHTRDNLGVYADLAANPVKELHLDAAVRFEHYSDFADTTVGKLTGRYDFNPSFALRGTVSTGLRAPTLAEEFYSGTNVAPNFAFVQLPPNSAAAKVAGFNPLQPEKSTNFSGGFVAHLFDGLQVTLDAYDIKIKKRIVGSGNLVGLSGTVVSQPVLDAISNHLNGGKLDSGITYAGINLFTNGVDTETKGLELTANYASDFGDLGHVDWSLGLNLNDTSITKSYPLPSVDVNVGYGQTAILTPNAVSILTKATPKEKIVAGAYWSRGQWSVTLRETVYGPTSALYSFNTLGSGPGTTDLRVPTTGITDIDVTYKVSSAIRISLGANNAFDKKPPSMPTLYDPGSGAAGAYRSADGNSNVYNEPAGYSPYGINGGYYYGRVTYSW